MDQKILHFTMKAALYAKVSGDRDTMVKEAIGLQDITGALSNAWNSGSANVMQAYNALPPHQKQVLLGGLIGGGAGAGLGGIHAMTQSKNKRHLLRDILAGGVAGAGLGAGGTHLFSDVPVKDWLKKQVQAKPDSAEAAGVNWANDPAMKMLNVAPSMALAPNPAAMMNAATAGAVAPGPSSVEDAYKKYMQGKSPEQIIGYLNHLHTDLNNPDLAQTLANREWKDHPLRNSTEALGKNVSDHQILWGMGAGGGGTALGQLKREMQKAKQHRLNPLYSRIDELKDAKKPIEFPRHDLPANHPSVKAVGEKYNEATNALYPPPGVPAFSAEQQQKILDNIHSNPEGLNPYVQRVVPTMKVVKSRIPSEPAAAPTPSPILGPSGKPVSTKGPGPQKPQYKYEDVWTNEWHRAKPNTPEAEPFLQNTHLRPLKDLVIREGKWPAAKRVVGRGAMGAAAGAATGAATNYVYPWARDTAVPWLLNRMKNYFNAPDTSTMMAP